MAVASTRNTSIVFSGDLTATINANAASNAASPGKTDLVTLAIGDNTITPPTGGSTPKACTIDPPTGNVSTITLKGDAADVGVVLHKTDPTSIALDDPTDTFILEAAAEIVGVRLTWS